MLGRFNGIGLVQGYAPLLQLGILNGLNRELPFYVGKGDRKRVVELAAAAQAWAWLIGGQVGLALVGVAVWQLVQRNLWLAAGWATNAILVVLLFYNNYYLQMTYRTSHDFARLAMVGVVENAVALAAVLLVRMLSFYGLCLRLLLAAAVSTALLYYWRPVRVGPRWHFQHLLHLLIIGFPIFIVGELYLLWTVLDSTLVFWNAGDRGLGLYYLVITAIGTLEMLPMAVSQVIYPRMSESFGRTGKLGELVRMSIKPTVLTVAGMTAAAAAGWWLVGPVVAHRPAEVCQRGPRHPMGPLGRGGQQFCDSVQHLQRCPPPARVRRGDHHGNRRLLRRPDVAPARRGLAGRLPPGHVDRPGGVHRGGLPVIGGCYPEETARSSFTVSTGFQPQRKLRKCGQDGRLASP